MATEADIPASICETRREEGGETVNQATNTSLNKVHKEEETQANRLYELPETLESNFDVKHVRKGNESSEQAIEDEHFLRPPSITKVDDQPIGNIETEENSFDTSFPNWERKESEVPSVSEDGNLNLEAMVPKNESGDTQTTEPLILTGDASEGECPSEQNIAVKEKSENAKEEEGSFLKSKSTDEPDSDKVRSDEINLEAIQSSDNIIERNIVKEEMLYDGNATPRVPILNQTEGIEHRENNGSAEIDTSTENMTDATSNKYELHEKQDTESSFLQENDSTIQKHENSLTTPGDCENTTTKGQEEAQNQLKTLEREVTIQSIPTASEQTEETSSIQAEDMQENHEAHLEKKNDTLTEATDAIKNDASTDIHKVNLEDLDLRKADEFKNEKDKEVTLLKEEAQMEKPSEFLHAAVDTKASALGQDTGTTSLEDGLLTADPQEILSDETEERTADAVDTKEESQEVQNVSTTISYEETEDNSVIEVDDSQVKNFEKQIKEPTMRKAPTSVDSNAGKVVFDEPKTEKEEEQNTDHQEILDDKIEGKTMDAPEEEETLNVQQNVTTVVPEQETEENSFIQIDDPQMKNEEHFRENERPTSAEAFNRGANDDKSIIMHKLETEDEDVRRAALLGNEESRECSLLKEEATVMKPVESLHVAAEDIKAFALSQQNETTNSIEDNSLTATPQGISDYKTEEKTIDEADKKEETLQTERTPTIVANEDTEESSSIHADGSQMVFLEKEIETPSLTETSAGFTEADLSKVMHKAKTGEEDLREAELEKNLESTMLKKEVSMEKPTEYSQEDPGVNEVPASRQDIDTTSCFGDESLTANPQGTLDDITEEKIAEGTDTIEETSEQNVSTDPHDEIEEKLSNNVDDSHEQHLLKEGKEPTLRKAPEKEVRDAEPKVIHEPKSENEDLRKSELSENPLVKEDEETEKSVESLEISPKNHLLKEDTQTESVESLEIAPENIETSVSSQNMETTSTLEEQSLTADPQGILDDNIEETEMIAVEMEETTIENVAKFVSNEENKENILIQVDDPQVKHDEHMENESEKPSLMEASSRDTNVDESIIMQSFKTEEGLNRAELLEHEDNTKCTPLKEEAQEENTIEMLHVAPKDDKAVASSEDIEITNSLQDQSLTENSHGTLDYRMEERTIDEANKKEKSLEVQNDTTSVPNEETKEDSSIQVDSSEIENLEKEQKMESASEALTGFQSADFSEVLAVPDTRDEDLKEPELLHSETNIESALLKQEAQMKNLTEYLPADPDDIKASASSKGTNTSSLEEHSVTDNPQSTVGDQTEETTDAADKKEETLEAQEVATIISKEDTEDNSCIHVDGLQMKYTESLEKEREETSLSEVSWKAAKDDESTTMEEGIFVDKDETKAELFKNEQNTESTLMKEEGQMNKSAESLQVPPEDVKAFVSSQDTNITISLDPQKQLGDQTEATTTGETDMKGETPETQNLFATVLDDTEQNQLIQVDDSQMKHSEQREMVTETLTRDGCDEESVIMHEARIGIEDTAQAELLGKEKNTESTLLKQGAEMEKPFEPLQVAPEDIEVFASGLDTETSSLENQSPAANPEGTICDKTEDETTDAAGTKEEGLEVQVAGEIEHADSKEKTGEIIEEDTYIRDLHMITAGNITAEEEKSIDSEIKIPERKVSNVSEEVVVSFAKDPNCEQEESSITKHSEEDARMSHEKYADINSVAAEASEENSDIKSVAENSSNEKTEFEKMEVHDDASTTIPINENLVQEDPKDSTEAQDPHIEREMKQTSGAGISQKQIEKELLLASDPLQESRRETLLESEKEEAQRQYQDFHVSALVIDLSVEAQKDVQLCVASAEDSDIAHERQKIEEASPPALDERIIEKTTHAANMEETLEAHEVATMVSKEDIEDKSFIHEEDLQMRYTKSLEKEREETPLSESSCGAAKDGESTTMEEAMFVDDDETKSEFFKNERNTESLAKEEEQMDNSAESLEVPPEDAKASVSSQDTDITSSHDPQKTLADQTEATTTGETHMNGETPETQIFFATGLHDTEQNQLIQVDDSQMKHDEHLEKQGEMVTETLTRSSCDEESAIMHEDRIGIEDIGKAELLGKEKNTESTLLKQGAEMEKPFESLQVAPEYIKVFASGPDTETSTLENQSPAANPEGTIDDKTEDETTDAAGTKEESLEVQNAAIVSNEAINSDISHCNANNQNSSGALEEEKSSESDSKDVNSARKTLEGTKNTPDSEELGVHILLPGEEDIGKPEEDSAFDFKEISQDKNAGSNIGETNPQLGASPGEEISGLKSGEDNVSILEEVPPVKDIDICNNDQSKNVENQDHDNIVQSHEALEVQSRETKDEVQEDPETTSKDNDIDLQMLDNKHHIMTHSEATANETVMTVQETTELDGKDSSENIDKDQVEGKIADAYKEENATTEIPIKEVQEIYQEFSGYTDNSAQIINEGSGERSDDVSFAEEVKEGESCENEKKGMVPVTEVTGEIEHADSIAETAEIIKEEGYARDLHMLTTGNITAEEEKGIDSDIKIPEREVSNVSEEVVVSIAKDPNGEQEESSTTKISEEEAQMSQEKFADITIVAAEASEENSDVAENSFNEKTEFKKIEVHDDDSTKIPSNDNLVQEDDSREAQDPHVEREQEMQQTSVERTSQKQIEKEQLLASDEVSSSDPFHESRRETLLESEKEEAQRQYQDLHRSALIKESSVEAQKDVPLCVASTEDSDITQQRQKIEGPSPAALDEMITEKANSKESKVAESTTNNEHTQPAPNEDTVDSIRGDLKNTEGEQEKSNCKQENVTLDETKEGTKDFKSIETANDFLQKSVNESAHLEDHSTFERELKIDEEKLHLGNKATDESEEAETEKDECKEEEASQQKVSDTPTMTEASHKDLTRLTDEAPEGEPTCKVAEEVKSIHEMTDVRESTVMKKDAGLKDILVDVKGVEEIATRSNDEIPEIAEITSTVREGQAVGSTRVEETSASGFISERAEPEDEYIASLVEEKSESEEVEYAHQENKTGYESTDQDAEKLKSWEIPIPGNNAEESEKNIINRGSETVDGTKCESLEEMTDDNITSVPDTQKDQDPTLLFKDAYLETSSKHEKSTDRSATTDNYGANERSVGREEEEEEETLKVEEKLDLNARKEEVDHISESKEIIAPNNPQEVLESLIRVQNHNLSPKEDEGKSEAAPTDIKSDKLVSDEIFEPRETMEANMSREQNGKMQIKEEDEDEDAEDSHIDFYKEEIIQEEHQENEVGQQEDSSVNIQEIFEVNRNENEEVQKVLEEADVTDNSSRQVASTDKGAEEPDKKGQEKSVEEVKGSAAVFLEDEDNIAGVDELDNETIKDAGLLNENTITPVVLDAAAELPEKLNKSTVYEAAPTMPTHKTVDDFELQTGYENTVTTQQQEIVKWDEKNEICTSEKMQSRDEETQMLSAGKHAEKPGAADTLGGLTEDDNGRDCVEAGKTDFSSDTNSQTEISQTDGVQETKTETDTGAVECEQEESTEPVLSTVKKGAELIEQDSEATAVNAGMQEQKSGTDSAVAPEAIAVACGQKAIVSGDCQGQAELKESTNLSMSKMINENIVRGSLLSEEQETRDHFLKLDELSNVSHVENSDVAAAEDGPVDLQSASEVTGDVQESIKDSGTVSIKENLVQDDPNQNTEAKVSVGGEEAVTIQQYPYTLEHEIKEQQPGKPSETVPEAKSMNCEEEKIVNDVHNNLTENSTSVVTDEVSPSNIHQGTADDGAQGAKYEETLKPRDVIPILPPSDMETAQRNLPLHFPRLDGIEVTEQEPTPPSETDKHVVLEADHTKNANSDTPIANKDILVPENTDPEKCSPAQGEKLKPSEPEQEEANYGNEKRTSDEREKPESIDMDKPSLSDLLQVSTKEATPMADQFTAEKEPAIHREELLEEKTHEVAKSDEEKDNEEESNGQNKSDSCSEAPVMVEAGDADVKAAHKKSHNLLSGVGSKVKHSIAKVKKAITGKSSHPKPTSPK